MTIPSKYSHHYIPTKYFLLSYRSLTDGQRAIRLLGQQLAADSFWLSDWKIHWIAATTLLRSSIDLFRQDAKSCLPHALRIGFQDEFDAIRADKAQHSIFWDFLRHERDAIIHHYKWQAYEAWIAEDGNEIEVSRSLLVGRPENVMSVLLMREGAFKGRNSVELLKEAEEWVEARIFSALTRGGFDPEERRNLVTFAPRPPNPPGLLTILSGPQ